MVYIDSRMNQKIIAILVECASSEMHLNVEDSKIVASGRSGIIVKTTSRRSDCKGKAVCVKILFAERGTAQTEYLNGYRAHEALNTYKHSVKCPRHYCFYSVSARGLIGYHVILMDHIDHAVVGLPLVGTKQISNQAFTSLCSLLWRMLEGVVLIATSTITFTAFCSNS